VKNDFPFSNNILEVNKTNPWLETATKHHQSLDKFIFGGYIITNHVLNATEAHK